MKQQLLDLKLTNNDFDKLALHLEKAKPNFIPTTEQLEESFTKMGDIIPSHLRDKVRSDVFAMQKTDIEKRDQIIILQAKLVQLHQLFQENGILELRPVPEREAEPAAQA